MTNLDQYVTGSLDDWLGGLPEYQRSEINAMLEIQSPTDVAVAWLTASGPRDTAPFGGVKVGAKLLYGNLLKELQKLFCGGIEYDRERKELLEVGLSSKLMIVAAVSAAIAPHVGVAAVILAPVIAIALGVMANAGHASVCEALLATIDAQAERDIAG